MIDGFKDAGFMLVYVPVLISGKLTFMVFSYIKNHGIPQDVVDRVFAESAAFFNRPKDQKETLAWVGSSPIITHSHPCLLEQTPRKETQFLSSKRKHI